MIMRGREVNRSGGCEIEGADMVVRLVKGWDFGSGVLWVNATSGVIGQGSVGEEL